ncbi:MAG: hypothetical protein IT438_03800 [Phycisphaerales bacterium]|nr:hypothetical protein [Phycisphaerales bacterium]
MSSRAIGWLSALAGTALAGGAMAGPMPVARRTVGVLVSDTTLDAVYLARDLTGDGDARDTDETTVFFDATNASGVGAPTGQITAMYQRADGTVFLGDNDSRSIYALKDLNGDFDAQDPGEARLWFSEAGNSGLFTLAAPNGLTEGPDGRVCIVNAGAGTGASAADAIYRTADLNNDGDANDSDESSVWIDTFTLVPSSSAFGAGFVGNAMYFADSRGGDLDTIFRAEDTTEPFGVITATELTTFYAEPAVGAVVPVFFTAVSDGASIYTHDNSSSAIQTVWRLTDTDNSGTLDIGSEAVQVWTEANLAALAPPQTMGASFDVTIGPDRLAIASSGTDLNDEVIVATDLPPQDGDFNDPGETAIFVQGAAGVSFPENIRSVLFIGPACVGDFNGTGGVTVQDIFDFLGAYFANDPRANVNTVGGVSVQDIFDFLAAYFAGCA